MCKICNKNLPITERIISSVINFLFYLNKKNNNQFNSLFLSTHRVPLILAKVVRSVRAQHPVGQNVNARKSIQNMLSMFDRPMMHSFHRPIF